MLEAVLKSPGVPTQAEFHEVIATRADRWYSACLRITRDRGLAEDAVQDALLSAWDKRHQFDRGSRLDTWIHRIALNAALQILRKKKPQAWEPLECEIADDTARPDDDRFADELGEELTAALVRLSEIERVCFVLKHLEQWRLKEIAEELGTNVGTIKQALFRALKKLRVSMASLRSEP